MPLLRRMRNNHVISGIPDNMVLKILLLTAVVNLLPGICSGEVDNPPLSDNEEVTISTEDEETDTDEDAEDDDSFLAPYYESKDTTGCFLTGCSDSWDIIRIITSVNVRYNSNPAENGGVRAFLGGKGNPVAVNIRFGLSGIESSPGYMAGVLFRTPSPFVFDILYHRVKSEEFNAFSVLYTGIETQLVYNLPLQLMFGAQAAFPTEDGRSTLTGWGFGLLGEYSFEDHFGIALDYRLVWVGNLPLHRGEMRISWSSAPLKLFTGCSILRNNIGDHIFDPCAGLEIFF